MNNFKNTINNDNTLSNTTVDTLLKTTTKIDPKEIPNVIYNDYIETTTGEEPYTKFKDNNLDAFDLCNFSLYGSAVQLINNKISNIIKNYPKALYINNVVFNKKGNNFENYQYNPYTNTSFFRIHTNYVENPLNLNFSQNNVYNNQQSLTNNFINYVIYINNTEYPILNYIAPPTITDNYLTIYVNGDPFKHLTEFIPYFIKPSSKVINDYFNELDTLDCNILNRYSTPIYNSTFYVNLTTDTGYNVKVKKQLNFPTTDGYNLDVESNLFTTYLNELLSIAEEKDKTYSNVILRKLVSPLLYKTELLKSCEGETQVSGELMETTLNIIGQLFDKTRQNIISLSKNDTIGYLDTNNVNYNNLSNLLEKKGWSNITDLEINNKNIELWKSLLVNSDYIFNSKGTKKAINILLSLLGIPKEFISYKEFIYIAKQPINVDVFKRTIRSISPSLTLADFNVDNDGYPIMNKDCFEYSGDWIRSGIYSDERFQHIRTSTSNYIDSYRKLIPDLQTNVLNEKFTVVDSTTVLSMSGITSELINSNGTSNLCLDITATTQNSPVINVSIDCDGCEVTGITEVNSYCIENNYVTNICSGNIVCNHSYTCNSDGTVTLNINTIGGTQPYIYSGNVNGIEKTIIDGLILDNDDIVTWNVTDFNGCSSNEYTTKIVCTDVVFVNNSNNSDTTNDINNNTVECENLTIEVNYECEDTDTETVIMFSILGGTGNYEINSPISSGDLFTVGEILTIEVEDSNGCTGRYSEIIEC